MMLHVKRWMPYALIAGLAILTTIGGYLHGWATGYRQAQSVEVLGWNLVAYGVDSRRAGADLERLLGRQVTEGCYETVFDLERPVPLRLAIQRSTRESQCLTEGFKAATEALRARRTPHRRGLTLEDVVPNAPTVPELPAGHVRAQPITWAWRPSWLPAPGAGE